MAKRDSGLAVRLAAIAVLGLLLAAAALLCGCAQLPGARRKHNLRSLLDADELKSYEAKAKKNEEASRQNRTDTKALKMLAIDYSLLGRGDDAVKTILKAVSLEPADYNFRMDAGMILSGDGRHKGAAKQYEEAVRLKPNYYLPLCQLADEYIELGRYEDAVARSNLAVSLAPEDLVPHHDLAVAYHRLGKNAEAATEFAEFKRLAADYQAKNVAENEADVRNRPDDTEARFLLAFAYEEVGNHSRALAEYTKILTIKPDDASADMKLGDVYVELGRYQDAVSAYRDSISRLSAANEGAYGAHAGLATAYFRLKKYNDAEREYKIALTGNPLIYNDVRVSLGDLYAEMGRNDDATKQYETAIRVDEYGGAEAHIHLAKLLVKMGRLQDAVKEYKKAVKAIPELPEAHAGLCRTYLKLGDERSAREELDEVMTLDKEQGEKLRAELKL